MRHHPPSPSNAPIGVGTCKISAKAIQYVNDVLKSERLSYGPYIQKFERVFAAAHDCKFAIMTNSGTSSLMIALHALKEKYGWQKDDEVIVPAVTFVATANVVIQLGLRPVFVDVDPVYYEIDPKLIEAAITPKTRCIIPVHLFGQPCDMNEIWALAQKYQLKIIEDSCETMFTRIDGKSVGSLGHIACFSTYVAHLLSTGVGGLCTTNDPDLAIAMRSLANHGRDSIYLSIDDDDGKSEEEKRLIIEKRFSFVTTGYSFRATELEGALGLAEFENREQMLSARRENAEYFTDGLKGLEEHLQLPAIRSNSGHAFMMFPIVVKDEEDKRGLVSYLEARGIETRDMLPLVNQPVYHRLLGIREADYPVAANINKRGFYIGCHQGLTEIQKEYILETFQGYYSHSAAYEQRTALFVMSKIRGKVDPLVLQNVMDSMQLSIFDEKVLLDAGSGAGFTDNFAKAGFRVISQNVGKGTLLKKALELTKCKYVLVVGVDGADNASDLNNILIKLRHGNEVVVGSRFMPGGGRETVRPLSYRSIGNRFFTFLTSTVFRSNVTDCNNLLRGFVRSAVRDLKLASDGDAIMFEMTVAALKNGLRYTECPTVERTPLLSVPRRNRIVSALFMLKVLLSASVHKLSAPLSLPTFEQNA